MQEIQKNQTKIRLDDGIEQTPEVLNIIEELLNYQIGHPIRLNKTANGNRISRVPLNELDTYKHKFKSITIPVENRTITLYPVFGCTIRDITQKDIDECVTFCTDPIFISRDEDGQLYVGT